MTLRGVGAASDGRFMATSVAGYERGERNISLERFTLLCKLYDVPPDRLLAEILRATEGRPEAEIDLTTLETLGSAEGALVSGFVRQVSSLRREPPAETVSLRAGTSRRSRPRPGERPRSSRRLWPGRSADNARQRRRRLRVVASKLGCLA